MRIIKWVLNYYIFYSNLCKIVYLIILFPGLKNFKKIVIETVTHAFTHFFFILRLEQCCGRDNEHFLLNTLTATSATDVWQWIFLLGRASHRWLTIFRLCNDNLILRSKRKHRQSRLGTQHINIVWCYFACYPCEISCVFYPFSELNLAGY